MNRSTDSVSDGRGEAEKARFSIKYRVGLPVWQSHVTLAHGDYNFSHHRS